MEIRLDTLLSQAGYCARRKVQAFLTEHQVTLGTGQRLLEPGIRIDEKLDIHVNGQAIRTAVEKLYFALYKPTGYISSVSDTHGRPLASSLIKESQNHRLYNVGRLDLNSCGLLLFTNDGLWAQRLMHPRYEVEKEYEVVVDRPFTIAMMERMKKGIYIDGEELCISSYAAMPDRRQTNLILKEGKNREIRRLFSYFDIRVKLLKRIRIGHILLGNMAPGGARRLSAREVETFSKK